jgi:Ion channel
MPAAKQSRPELWLLLSLLLVILLYPALDHGDLRRFVLTALIFVPVVISTVRLSQTKRWAWPALVLMGLVIIFGALSFFFPNPIVLAMKWGSLAAFFAFTVAGLFVYLRNAPSITRAHLYAAASNYLLLGMLWFAIYCAVDAIFPGAFSTSANVVTDRQSEMLYFSLVTLTTIGYGDVVARQEEVRMLAALEGVAGVLYIAITMAILVSALRRENVPPPE